MTSSPGTAPHGYHNLTLGIIGELKTGAHVLGVLAAELRKASVGRILGAALLQGADTRVADVPGGDKIRLSNPQGDGIGHLLQDVKEFSDGGGGHVLDTPIQDSGIVNHTK